MKKILLISFLCVLIFGFGTADSLHAFPTVGVPSELPYVGTDEVSSYDWSDVQVVIDMWNGTNSPPELPLPPVTETYTEFSPPSGSDYKEYDITWTGDWTYLTTKYDGYIDVFYIVGLTTYSWKTTVWPDNPPKGHGLSHWRLWNPTSVPEPATMLLLGSGLIGLGVFGRKKLFK